MTMSPWSLIFLVLLAISALFGFGGFAPAAAGIARIFMLMFSVLFVVSFMVGGCSEPRHRERRVSNHAGT